MAGYGSTLTIQSSGFSSQPGQNIVRFGNQTVPVLSATPTTLTVQVPGALNASENSCSLSVTFNGQTAVAPEMFRLAPPEITGFTPANAPFGSEITISGKNFSSYYYDNEVFFNGKRAHIVRSDGESITVQVPTNLTSRQSQISVTVAGQTGLAGTLFTLPPPVITRLEKTSGKEGDMMTIQGVNFKPLGSWPRLGGASGGTETDAVKFGDVPVERFTYFGTDQIVFYIPSNPTGTPVKISVTFAGQTAVSTQEFTYIR